MKTFTTLAFLLFATHLVYSQKPQTPTEKVLYNIILPRGLSSAKFLSCNKSTKVDLWHKDDGEGRQKWKFIKISNGAYNIEVSNPGGNRKYLSCSNSGVVDLWDKDDNSGRQQWELIKKSNGTFNIMSVGVKDKFLSCNTSSGVDLWNTDDNSGRQQWKLTPENLKIVDITFDAAHSSKTAMPDFIINSNISNDSDVAQTMTATYERVAVTTSSFEHQSGFCYEVSVETEFGLPGLVEGKVSVTTSTTQTWTEGKTETREDSRTYAFPVNVPPRSTITTTASVSQVKLDVPYTVTAISSETGETIRSTGIWKGVSLGNISYKIIQK